MAIKNIRNTGTASDTWQEWYEWTRKNPDLYNTCDPYNSKLVEEEAIRTGKSVDDVVAERHNRYNEIRQMWLDEVNANSAKTEQVAMVRNNTLDSICSVYQRADRILTNLPINFYLTDDQDLDAPAWNDGKDISFNARTIKALDEDTIASLHGLNYHELAHLMFTPRTGTALGKWVRETTVEEVKRTVQALDGTEVEWTWKSDPKLVDPQRAKVFNILEDARAEYYLVKKYPNVRPFLIATVGDYLADNADPDNFVLLAGRRYFPRELRMLSAQMFVSAHGEDIAKQVYSIVTEYRTLVFPRQYERATQLIQALIDLLPDLAIQTPNGCTQRPLPRNGRPVGEKEQGEITGEGEAEGEDDLFGNGAGAPSTPKDYAVNPDTADFNIKSDELTQKLEEAVKRAKADKSFQQRVSETIRAITKDNSVKSLLRVTKGELFEPTQLEVTASRLFGQELERLRIDSDPAWELELPTGKLNVRRAMNADVNEINKLFDRWETGNDDYEIEACILIDRSGSMWQELGSACRSAWIIKRAIEKINGSVTVMTFSDDSTTLYRADEKSKANSVKIVGAGGGTDPAMALLESERITGLSSAKTKLVFVLTDGHFQNTVKSDEIIKRMRDAGVYTSVVFLGTEDYISGMSEKTLKDLTHGADTFRAISKPIDLVKVAKDVVRHNVKGGRRG